MCRPVFAKTIFAMIAGVIFLASGAFAGEPAIEAYGRLAGVRQVSISPDGQRYSYLSESDGEGLLGVVKIDGEFERAYRTTGLKVRDAYFVDKDHIVLLASDTLKIGGYSGRLEYSAALALPLEKRKIIRLLQNTDDLYPAQSGLGQIVGVSADGQSVFMPAYTGRRHPPPSVLFKVNLKSGKGRRFVSGGSDTIDWIVDQDGVVLAREDYDNKRNLYRIYTRLRGKWELMYEEKSPQIPLSLMGVTPDRNALVVVDRRGWGEFSKVYEMTFDGQISGPVFQRDDADIDSILVDNNRTMFGVSYSGFYPSYEFYDKSLEHDVLSVQATIPEASVSLVSWTDDLEYLVFYVQGTGYSGEFYSFDRSRKKLNRIAQARSAIKREDVGPVYEIAYKARDGLTIPAVMTAPPDADIKNLPLIVMPHGGPESYDAIGFDWMAQYFANRGYLVFQPNFRGSSGFGADFRDAGLGEWGEGMQDDITDGVKALIRSGRVDADRICIIGASYGGYAALAGGAFTPDLYKCVGAVAPVTDLPLMLATERSEWGRGHWVYDYWRESIGDPASQKEKLRSISPAFHADKFSAPVLLIHGRDDLVVPMRQSVRMERELVKAGKPVTLEKLKGEDHWLSTSETRLATLKSLATFVDRHIGAH